MRLAWTRAAQLAAGIAAALPLTGCITVKAPEKPIDTNFESRGVEGGVPGGVVGGVVGGLPEAPPPPPPPPPPAPVRVGGNIKQPTKVKRFGLGVPKFSTVSWRMSFPPMNGHSPRSILTRLFGSSW